MQVFKNRLSTAEIRDLADFVLAADGYHLPPDGPVARGAELSRTHGCESCHGVAGSGGVRNPGAFIGSVASWVGPDFPHLVAGRAEFGEWVLGGRSRRLEASRPASFFLDRANLFMPALRGHLGEAEVDALWAYVQWLRGRWGRGGAVGAAAGP
jgi:mono/diheme cytochrome c family protein